MRENTQGPLIRACVNGTDSRVFLDTGANINIIGLDYLRKVRTGVTLITPHNSIIEGVTGNSMKVYGKTRLRLTLCSMFSWEIEASVTEKSFFPGDILIGFNTMREVEINILPASDGVKIANMLYVPFLSSKKNEIDSDPVITSNETQAHISTDTIVAKRSEGTDIEEKIKSIEPKTHSQTSNSTHNNQKREVTANQPAAVKKIHRPVPEMKPVQIRPGFIVESTLLYPQEICKVKLKVKGLKKGQEIISLSHSVRIKGVQLDAALYLPKEGLVEVMLINTLNRELNLKPGTHVVLFQILEHPVKVINEEEEVRDEVMNVSSVQPDEDLSEKFRKHLSPTSRQDLDAELIDLLMRYRDAVALPGDALGRTSVLKHHIKLKPGTQPIYVPAYRLPHSKLAQVDRVINEMLSQEVIQPSCSEWNFPMILVDKPDGSVRPVVDFRKLNQKTIPDRIPLPVIADVLRSLGTENKWFSVIDIKSAFWQIELDKESREMCAFSTPTGHFEYLRMPMGLSNSSLTYTRLMNNVLQGLIGNTASVFLDDILVVSKTEEEHFRKLDLVLSRLAAAGLKIKLEKCKFMKREVKYLGHVLDQNGMRAVHSKVKAVEDFPIPTSVEKVRSFLGLTGYYRKFIKNYAHISQPLTSLLKKNVKFHWEAEQQEAFDTLKTKLTTSPVLIFPNYEQEFILVTDASDIGLGGVLMQERDNKLQPIAYASRLCNAAERNYSITERETLAVIHCLEHFRDMILGYKIKVWTDHTAIQNLFKHKNLRGRLARWFVTLQNYDVDFNYIPGKKNTVADALSRNTVNNHSERVMIGNIKDLVTLNQEQITEELNKDEVWSKVIKYLKSPELHETPKLPGKLKIEELTVEDDLIYRDAKLTGKSVTRDRVTQLVIPQSMTKDIMALVHDSAPSSHPAKEKTYQRAQLKYYWPRMRKDIYAYVENCQICARTKGHTSAPAPMLTYPTPNKPWERVHIDTLELPLSENGYKYLFVAIDYFSRYAILHPIPNKKAETIASAIFSEIITNHTTPKVIVTDNGGEFNNEVLSELCKIFGVKKVNVMAYHPQSNGVVERLNGKILSCLRTLIDPYSITWDSLIPHVKCALNTQINAATGETPHYILYGEDKKLPYELLNSTPSPVYNIEDYVKVRLHKFQLIYARIQDHLKKYSEHMRDQQHKRAKTTNIDVNDNVMVRLHTPIAESNKLSPKFSGPYRVIEVAGGNKYRLRHIESGDTCVKHVDDLKRTSIDREHINDHTNDTSNEQTEANKTIEQEDNETMKDTDESESQGNYRNKLRSYNKINVVISEEDENKFYQMINDIMNELHINCNSFYR